MKKNSFYCAIIVMTMTAMLSVIIVSCKKAHMSEAEAAAKGQATLDRILDFKEQVDYYKANPNARDGQTITLDEAVWNIENLFNLTYAVPDQTYSEITKFYFSLYLCVDNEGKVLMSDLISIYEQAIDNARIGYMNTGYAEKGFLFLAVEIGGQNSNAVRLDFTGIVSNRGDQPIWPPHDTAWYGGPFNTTDSWEYRAPFGKCIDPDYGSGADKELQWYLQQYINTRLETPDSTYRAVYLNRLVVTFNGRNAPSYAFYRTDTDFTCIDFNTMNYLWLREKLYIAEILPNDNNGPVFGYVPTFITIDGTELPAIGNNVPKCITHCNEVIYTQRVLVNINEVGEVQDLLDN